jgi:mRNA-degrading endonuclease RelE of RelBE toxin-antitoxin system
MRFIETSIFSKAIDELLDEEQFRALQLALLARPEAGALIRKTNGLRKMRWALQGGGKRGGIRVIYYWDKVTDSIYLLFAHPKSAQKTLTSQQLNLLSKLVREEFP